MAKKVVIIQERDYNNIINELLGAKRVLGQMRKTKNRVNVERKIDRAFDILTGKDDLDHRVDLIESIACSY